MSCLVHCRSVTVKRRDRPIFEQVADIEKLVERQTILLSHLRVRSHIVQLSETPGESYMASIVQPGIPKCYNAVLTELVAQHTTAQ